jgi:hypothetical protein
MILKGNQRGGATAMGLHLLRTDENDHVEIHQIRGFVARDVVDALREAQAISRGTRCKQFMFSLSLSPPETETVANATFERAIDEIENALGLAGQPRVIVFHEKNGRRHSHCVWSRVDGQMMKAINLSHYKLRLKDMSRKLYLEHGWRMPRGLVSQAERDPFNFSREEWQQARRAQRDPKILKEVFKDCWAISDSGKSFRQALSTHGLYLARGDRRGYVAIDWRGKTYSISRWTEISTKAVAARLEGMADLPSLADAKADLARRIEQRFNTFASANQTAFSNEYGQLWRQRDSLVADQRRERAQLNQKLQEEFTLARQACAVRLRTGFRGLWDWISGKSRRIQLENANTMATCESDALLKRENLRNRQLADRRVLQTRIREERKRHEGELAAIQAERLTTTSMLHETSPSRGEGKQRSKDRSRLGPSF